MKTVLILCLAALAFACGDDDATTDANTPLPDAAVADVGTDTPVTDDAGNDSGAPDVGTDGGPDSGPDSGPADTYETFGMAFMTSYCVECHEAGSSVRDYSTIDNIRRDMVGIRCGVTAEPLDDCSGFPPPRQFPVGSGPMPSDDERGRLVAWVEAGLL